MSGSTTFTWVGGQDINGANNWMTPLNWTVGGVAATRAPNGPTDIAIVNVDNGSQDAIISGGQSVTVQSLTIGGATVGTVQGGHVLVGGSSGVNGIGGGGGGTLTSIGAITITSPNTGGAIVGGNGGVIIAPSMTVNGGPDVLIGGGGTFDIPTMINNGGILADGGFFNLGPLVLNDTSITGTGFLEVSGNSALEINAATAQEVRVLVTAGQTASVIFDQPAAFTGSINLLNANSSVDLFFKGETPTTVAFDPTAPQSLVVTFADATTKRIPFASNGVVPLGVTASSLAGYGEVVLGTATPAPTPGQVAVRGSHDQYVLASAGGSLYVQDNVAARDGTQILPGTTLVAFTDGTGLFDPTGAAEDVARLYHAALNRAPDLPGLQAWTALIDNTHVPLSAVASAFAASPEFIQTYGALTDDDFVKQLYLNALGRPADPPGEKGWDDLLATGVARGVVAQSFAESAENRSHTLSTAGDSDDAEVFRLYQTAFNRTPDPDGKSFWSSALAGGVTPSQIAQDFIGSTEFQNIYGSLGTSDFVSALYTNALHRPADAPGLAAWTAALNGGANKADVIIGFSDSLENRAQTAGATHANWVFIPA
jgi:hypothetical protein